MISKNEDFINMTSVTTLDYVGHEFGRLAGPCCPDLATSIDITCPRFAGGGASSETAGGPLMP